MAQRCHYCTVSGPASRALSPAQLRLLRRLWQAQGKTVPETALGLGTSPESLLEEMSDLLDMGVAEIDAEDRVRMVPPRTALSNLIESQTASIETAVARLSRMAGLVVALGEESEPHRPVQSAGSEGREVDVEIVYGQVPADELRSWVEEGHGALRFLRPEQWRMPTEPGMAEAFRGALANGIPVRCIYPVRALQLARSVLEEHRRSGEEMRLLPEVPHQMAIVGNGHAMVVSGLGGEEVYTAIIREPLIVRVLVRYFDTLWERAGHMPEGDRPRDRSEERRMLLLELGRGARDEQIARSMGLGLRTVRRRVADLMIELGVETRFQAGVEAARRGWV